MSRCLLIKPRICLGITPGKIPITEIVAATKATAKHLDPLSVQQLGEGVSTALDSTKPPNKTLSHSQSSTLHDLQNDNTIVVFPDDKGNATIVMSWSTYLENMHSDSYTYHFEKSVSDAVKRLGYIEDRHKTQITPQYSY